MTEVNILHHGEEERLDHIQLMELECSCFDCRHLHEDQRTCDAFPDGIPSVFLYLDEVHKKPYPGDHGIQFEPRLSGEFKGPRRLSKLKPNADHVPKA